MSDGITLTHDRLRMPVNAFDKIINTTCAVLANCYENKMLLVVIYLSRHSDMLKKNQTVALYCMKNILWYKLADTTDIRLCLCALGDIMNKIWFFFNQLNRSTHFIQIFFYMVR